MGRIVGSDAGFGFALTKLGFLDEQPGSKDQWIGEKWHFLALLKSTVIALWRYIF